MTLRRTPHRLAAAAVVLAAACSGQPVSTPTSPSPGASPAMVRSVLSDDASAPGWAAAATGAIASLSIDPSVFKGGERTRGTVTLSAPAPTGGTTVSLASDDSLATLPASITIAEGGTSGTFGIATKTVATDVRMRITASVGGDSLKALMRITPENSIGSLSVSPARLPGGDSATGTVTLASVSPAGGTVVQLSSNKIDARVPASITIAAGAVSGTFAIETADVSSATEVWIGAAVGRDTREVQIRLVPSRSGGSGGSGTVTIGGTVE